MAAMIVNIAVPIGVEVSRASWVRNEVDAQATELLQGQDQLLSATGEPVKAPDHHDIEQAPASVCHQRIQARPAFLGSAGPIRVDLVKLPSALPDEFTEWLLLDGGVLVKGEHVAAFRFARGANSHVDGGAFRLR